MFFPEKWISSNFANFQAHESDPLLYLQVINTKLIKDKSNLKNGTLLSYCNTISCYNISFAHWNGTRIEKDKLEKHIIFTKLERNTKLHKFFGQSDILLYRLALLTFLRPSRSNERKLKRESS